jgi:translation initiation factor IF-1
MEKVFLVSPESFSKGGLLGGSQAGKPVLESEAFVEKVLGPNRYSVVLADGTKLTAVGPDSIRKGAKVRVAAFDSSSVRKSAEDNLRISIKNGDRLTALMPIKLVSGTEVAKIELYVEKEKAAFLSKKDAIVYLVFSVKTDTYGEIQWSVYLKGRQILVQVYAEKDDEGKTNLDQMIKEFEVSLKKKGFSLLAPTVILKKPFKVPAGFQLNVRG